MQSSIDPERGRLRSGGAWEKTRVLTMQFPLVECELANKYSRPGSQHFAPCLTVTNSFDSISLSRRKKRLYV